MALAPAATAARAQSQFPAGERSSVMERGEWVEGEHFWWVGSMVVGGGGRLLVLGVSVFSKKG